MSKWVYAFKEGGKEKNRLLGGKGANLAEMSKLALPIPPGFVITTEACNEYLARGRQFPSGLWDQVKRAMHQLEKETGRTFCGSEGWPLTVSVRSGAPISMPGMLETILNVGLTSRDTKRLEEVSRQKEFARTSFHRLILMYGKVVCNLTLKPETDEESLLKAFQRESGEPFPQDPYLQLRRAISAVFESWLSPNAVKARKQDGIADDLGTGVVVQAMVFGNMGESSGTGVVFSRNPSTGEKQIYGEYVSNAQGEDLVSGARTPENLAALERAMPEVYGQLESICDRLEKLYRDVQDIEFTIEQGKLWILQTRSAKRTPSASVRMIVDMVDEGLLTRELAIHRIDPAIIGQMLSTRLEDTLPDEAVARGIPSTPGAAVGRIALNREQVHRIAVDGDPIIFVRESISPDDVSIMPLIHGILTRDGGATSHAAVVARGLGKPCVVGCGELHVSLAENVVKIQQTVISSGDYISIDGGAGLVYPGKRRLSSANLQEMTEVSTLFGWVDETLRDTAQVFVNANTPDEVAALAIINVNMVGLCQTEWMFDDAPFLPLFQEALLAASEKQRETARYELEKLQMLAFEELFAKASDLPLTIRLLTAPLDDFLPRLDALITELTEHRLKQEWNKQVGEKEYRLQAILSLQQRNPDFGVHGARLFLARPELARLQLRALFTGACLAMQKHQITVHPRLLLPYVSSPNEARALIKLIKEVSDSVMQEQALPFRYDIGVLIETPAAALSAGKMAPLVDFLCLGTGGLTETTFGYAHGDSNGFISAYVAQQIFPADPMTWFDDTSVGALIRQAVQAAKQAKPDILVGAIGPLVYNFEALRLFTQLGLDYVSVDTSYLLRTRLALAQAKIMNN